MDSINSSGEAGDDASYVHYFSSEWRREERLTTRLTRALADVEGRRPETLDVEFQGAADPDALDRIFDGVRGNDRADGRIVLSLRGREIHAFANGCLVVY